MSDSRGRWPVAVSAFAALLLLVMSAATVSSVAATPRPVILSVSVSPKTIPAKGGPVVIRVSAAHTTTCTLRGVGIRVLQVPCGGPAAERLDFTANGASRQHVWTIDVIAKGAAGQRSASRSVTVTEGAANPLDACAAGPHCDDRLVSARYNTYGDLAPASVGDCTFAAAADWEHIALGKTPDPSEIRSEFAAAGGNAAGLSTAALWRYWSRQGIDGVVLSGLQSHQTNRADVESGVRASRAMLVELQFRAHDHFAQYSVTAGEHLAVVDGFTPEGPLVVSWGQTLQITWQQWNAKAIQMWGITTRPK
jgi:hypothetical protein